MINNFNWKGDGLVRTTTKVRDGYTVTVTVMNEPSEEAILEFRKAITQLLFEKGLLYKEDERQSKEG